jgi:hypothetical protein
MREQMFEKKLQERQNIILKEQMNKNNNLNEIIKV